MRGATLARGCDARPPAPSTLRASGARRTLRAPRSRAQTDAERARVARGARAPQFGVRPGKWHSPRRKPERGRGLPG